MQLNNGGKPMVKPGPTFLKFADFVREAAEKANIPQLEGLFTSTSPGFNRKSKPKPENEKGR